MRFGITITPIGGWVGWGFVWWTAVVCKFLRYHSAVLCVIAPWGLQGSFTKLKRYFLLNQIFVEWALFCDVLRLEWAYSAIWHCKFFDLLVFWLNHFLWHEYNFLISLNNRFLVIFLWRYLIRDVEIVVLKGIIFYLIVFCDLILDAIISLI